MKPKVKTDYKRFPKKMRRKIKRLKRKEITKSVYLFEKKLEPIIEEKLEPIIHEIYHNLINTVDSIYDFIQTAAEILKREVLQSIKEAHDDK